MIEITNSKTVITIDMIFNEIVKRVKDAGNWPADLVDYSLANDYAGDRGNLYNYEFDPVFTLAPGGCEGYYLELCISGYWHLGTDMDTIRLGTIKTLSTNNQAILEMSKLYGHCLIAYNEILYENLDKISRLGYQLTICFKNGKSITYDKANLKRLISKRLDDQDVEKFIARNNLSRKIREISMEEVREHPEMLDKTII